MTQVIDDEEVGLLIQITDFSGLHDALSLSHSPVPQGENNQGSRQAFCAWVTQCAQEIRFS